jgi:uncharacterized SAM-binding protein YcdF (DUF218 family)
MIRRFASLFLLVWGLGFGLFAVTLPDPAGGELTDAVVVLTGGNGRIERGLEILEMREAKRMLVSGVDPSVREGELASLKGAPLALFRCCVDLGKDAVDTRTNADEAARWMTKRGYKSVRLVTTDWHMRRARLELRRAVGKDIRVVGDSVESTPGLVMLVREYNKFWIRWLAIQVGL